MATRFDEIELLKPIDPFRIESKEPAAPEPVLSGSPVPASRYRRSLAFLTDLSLFIALALALSPLLPARELSTRNLNDWVLLAGFAGFVLLVSFYYFLYSWVVWGKTIGGAIFDLRVADVSGSPIDFRNAGKRWMGMILSTLMGGLGFLLALFPGAASLPDRMSSSRCFVVR